MTSRLRHCGTSAGLAFDSIAEKYDDIFTRSLIGRAQRGRRVGSPEQHLRAWRSAFSN